jgi:hypothetical protein
MENPNNDILYNLVNITLLIPKKLLKVLIFVIIVINIIVI